MPSLSIRRTPELQAGEHLDLPLDVGAYGLARWKSSLTSVPRGQHRLANVVLGKVHLVDDQREDAS
jgi:hypothetical protein